MRFSAFLWLLRLSFVFGSISSVIPRPYSPSSPQMLPIYETTSLETTLDISSEVVSEVQSNIESVYNSQLKKLGGASILFRLAVALSSLFVMMLDIINFGFCVSNMTSHIFLAIFAGVGLFEISLDLSIATFIALTGHLLLVEPREGSKMPKIIMASSLVASDLLLAFFKFSVAFSDRSRSVSIRAFKNSCSFLEDTDHFEIYTFASAQFIIAIILKYIFDQTF
jgi:hypothetical protein